MRNDNNSNINQNSDAYRNNPNQYHAYNANQGVIRNETNYRNAYQAFVAHENGKTKYYAVQQAKRDKIMRESAEKNAAYQQALADKEEARRKLATAKRNKADAATLAKLQQNFSYAESNANKLYADMEAKMSKALHLANMMNRSHAEQAHYYDEVVRGMGTNINTIEASIEEAEAHLREVHKYNADVRREQRRNAQARANGQQVDRSRRQHLVEEENAKERLAKLKADLKNQEEAYNEFYKTKLKLDMQAEDDAYEEKLKNLRATLRMENEIYEVRKRKVPNGVDKLGRQKYKTEKGEITYEQKRHEMAIKNAKLEHDKKMEQIREELKSTTSSYRMTRNLDNNTTEAKNAILEAQENQLQQIADNSRTIADNNAKLNDDSLFYSQDERTQMHAQNFKAGMQNRQIFNQTYGVQRDDAYKQLSAKYGKSISEIKDLFKRGVTAEFEDKDSDLVNIIKDANLAENSTGGSLLMDGISALLGGGGDIIGSVLTQAFSNAIGGVANVVLDAVSRLSQWLTAKIEPFLGTYYQYQSKLMTRLEGTDHTYDSIYKLIKKNIGMSPFVTQAKVMEKVADLVEKGIVQDLEERALLMAIGDKLVTTFEVENDNLLRLIRLQQKDSTAQYMGMEGRLNELLNKWFKDTTYLHDEFDTIEGLLMDLDSTMTDSVGINFAIQKWMAALSSVGMSSGTLERLTQGLVYLGTGDINALANQQDLQSLFAIVANQQMLDYADLLRNGVTESDINRMMRGIVQYINQINKSNTNVVKAQYQDLFNMTRADFEAISNLAQSSRFNMVYGASVASSDADTWLTEHINTIGERMHVSEKIDNLVENMLTSVATAISDKQALYVAYKIQGMLADANIPVISAVAQAAQLIPLGWSIIGEIGNVASSVSRAFKLDLNQWEQSDFESRGRSSATAVTSSGASSSTSSSYSSTVNSGVVSNGGSSSASSSNYSSSTSEGFKNAMEATAEYISSNVNPSETIESTFSSKDKYGKTFADYNEELRSAVSYSASSLSSIDSLVTANNIAAVSTSSAETIKEADTLGDLYKDLFKKSVHVIPDSGTWSSLLSAVTVNISTASIENVSRTLTSVNKILNKTDTAVDVHITNTEIKTVSELGDVSQAVQTLMSTMIVNALIKAKAAESNNNARDNAQGQKLTLEDLINKIVNGEVAVSVNNNNFDTVLSKYLMES